ncbi:helix-turn-helix transcriptional regulator [Cognatishimia activa]|uniref:Helix-turn-helix transcriptional regulator n=1 Tax=Cognatishimia activa TaxID=1715691 RepID=A0A975EQ00_9RHOB|nr:helix-turn-helix transcriptional regulator [Cognatishimia activa]
MNIKEVAADLRYCRRESGLSGADVAHLLHITKSRLSRIETGASSPKPSELCGFALIYGKDLFSMLPDVSGRIAKEVHGRLSNIPDAPSHWKASKTRFHFLKDLYQRLDHLVHHHEDT